MEKKQILSEIKRLVLLQEPSAEIILYGSHARGDFHPDSDMDLLILLQKDIISYADEKRISNPLYELELKTQQVISPFIKSRKTWYEKYPNTAIFINIKEDGIAL
jgi:predicted nucleotidyltransferase